MSGGSITSWTRIEPRSRDPEMNSGPNARVFDPLWFLTRQWQTGEYQAEDAGTPVLATIRGASAMLTRRFLGAVKAKTKLSAPEYDPLKAPLEVAVEQRPLGSGDGAPAMLPLAVEAGSHFLRMLEQQPLSKDYRDAFLSKFAMQAAAVPAGGPAAGFVRIVRGRALDGRALAATIRRRGAAKLASDAALKIAAGDRAEVRQTALNWLGWYDGLVSGPRGAEEDAWISSRLEYGVSVSARLSKDPSDERTLTALEYCDGHLGWSDFDLDDREVKFGTTRDDAASAFVETSIPAPVAIRGTPAPRFWEVEDGNLAYGLVSAGPSDLAQMLMVEYSGSYGNDWFVIPLTLPIGSVTRTDSLVVTDTFGVRSLLRPIGDSALPPPEWAMWQLDFIRAGGERGKVPASNLFFLPPSVGTVLEGRPLEQVLFMRDEMANLAWAIERSVEGPLEAAVTRLPGDADAPPEGAPGELSGKGLRYRLASRVPDNWVPLLPAQLKDEKDRVVSRLVRGAVLQPDGSGKIHPATGEILNAKGELILFDEEVPREGIRVDRIRRLTRWIDGTTIMWTGYRKFVGRGEGSSNLCFDRIVDSSNPQ